MAAVSLDIIGSSGLKQFGGHLNQEEHRRLRSQRVRYQTYREMSENDPVIGSILYAIETLARQVTWTVEPADEDPASVEQKEFVEGVFEDMSHSFQDFLSEIFTFLPMGWAYHEVVWKIRRGDRKDPRFRSRFDDGRIGIRKIPLRSQDTLDRWEFDEDGGIRGLWQTPYTFANNQGTVFIPIEKSLLFRTRTRLNSPEGYSLLRNAYRSWWFLKRLQEIEAIGVERNLAGMPVMQVPVKIMNPNASDQDRAIRSQLEEMIQRIKRDEFEGLLIPTEEDDKGNKTGYKFSLLSASGRRPSEVDPIIKRYEQRMASSVLADFALMGQDKVGSFALASSKTKLFAMSLGALLDVITETINRFLIPKLMKANDVNQELWPKLTHGDIEKPELQEVSNFVTQLAGAGALSPDEEMERKLRTIGDLPQKEETKKTGTDGR